MSSAQQLSDWLNGTPTGGPNGDGRYPLTYADGTTHLILCPQAQALATQDDESTPEIAANEASASAVEATQSASAAQQSSVDAAASAAAADASASAASTSESAAADSATAAAGSASTASTKATDAGNSASAAETSKTGADSAQAAAQTAQAASESARTLAQAWADNDEDVAVVADKFSAKHWAAKALASAQAAASYIGSVAWSAVTGKPTTLDGFGISDAYTRSQIDTALNTKANGNNAYLAGTTAFESAGGSSSLGPGTGDQATYTTFNTKLKIWWGLGIATYDDSVNGVYDARVGRWDTKAAPRVNGVDVWYPGNFNPATKANLDASGNLLLANGGSIQVPGGAKLSTGPAGGTWSVTQGTSSSNAFSIKDVTGTDQWGWDLNLNLTTSKSASFGSVTASGLGLLGTTSGAGPNHVLINFADNRYLTYNKAGGYFQFAGAELAADGGLSVNGNYVWHGGNFNPATKANLANPTFTSGATFFNDASFQIARYGNSLQLNSWDDLVFYRSSNSTRSTVWHSGNLDPAKHIDGVSDANAVANNGTYGVGTLPSPTTNTSSGSWESLINVCDGNWGFQISHPWFTEDVYVRSRQSGTFTAWRQLLHTGNAIYGQRVFTGWDSGVVGSVSCNNWFRATGQTGIFFNDYGGGWYMTDGTYVRAYNGKAVAASDFVITSDEREKAGIRPLEYRGRLTPISFTMKSTGKADFGFGAGAVKKLYPEAVGYIADTDRLQLSYGKLTAILSYQINALEDLVTKQQKQIDHLLALEDLVAKQQKQINQLLLTAGITHD